MRRMLATLLAPLFAASLLLISAGGVAADTPDPTGLDPVTCDVYDGFTGEPYDAIPPGSEVFIVEGWITNTRGQLQSYVNNVTWVLTVNGQPVDVSAELSGLIDIGSGWGDFFGHSIGTFEEGDTVQTYYDNVLKSASFDGAFHYPKGSVYGGGVNCSVAVSAG